MPNLVDDKCTEGSNENESECIAPLYIRSRHGSNAKPKALKPQNNTITSDIDFSELFSQKENTPLTFLNKRKYIKHRKGIIKTLKEIVKQHSLGIQTLFLAVLYFDIICSKMSSFDGLDSIAKICVILSAKFSDDGKKAFNLEESYRMEISQNYQSDEMFIVKLLDYNLNQYSSYDIISQILIEGVIYDVETNDLRKVDQIHSTIEKLIMMFIESNVFLDLSQSQIAFGIVGFAREIMKLEAFGSGLINVYHLDDNVEFYYEGLRKVKEYFEGSVNGTRNHRKTQKQVSNKRTTPDKEMPKADNDMIESTVI